MRRHEEQVADSSISCEQLSRGNHRSSGNEEGRIGNAKTPYLLISCKQLLLTS